MAIRRIKHKLAQLYFTLCTSMNVFRLHELFFLRRHLKFSTNDNALDVACGIGVYTNNISKRIKSIVGIDIVFDNVSIANHFCYENSFFYQGNAEKLCHKDNTLDIVISICALEHFKNVDNALREIYRVLKPGGQFLFTVDSFFNITDPDFIKFHKKVCFVENYFDVGTFSDKLTENGFLVDTIKPLMKSEPSAKIATIGIKLMNRAPRLFNVYSFFMYPLTLIFDQFSSSKEGVVLAVYGFKEK